MKKFTQTLLVVFMAVALFGTANGQTITNQYYNVTSGNGNGLRFWSSDYYKIHMGNSSYHKYGPVTDYSIKMNMNSIANRGWTWGVLNTTPIAALNNVGTFQLAKDLKVMGNTGIGTTSPNSKLHVNASSGQVGLRVQISGSSKFTVASNGGTTIGTYNNTPPANGLYVYDKININTTSANATGKINLRTGWGDWAHFESTSNTGYWAFHQGQNQTDFHIYYRHPDGSIIYPLRLKTDGSIETNEILVAELNATEINSKQLTLDIDNIADYVFDEDYSLRSLNEVEQFVKENKHLPGIPKGSDIESEGMNVAEMSNLLLEKIEELTLYLIEQDKEIEKLKSENKELKAYQN